MFSSLGSHLLIACVARCEHGVCRNIDSNRASSDRFFSLRTHDKMPVQLTILSMKNPNAGVEFRLEVKCYFSIQIGQSC